MVESINEGHKYLTIKEIQRELLTMSLQPLCRIASGRGRPQEVHSMGRWPGHLHAAP